MKKNPFKTIFTTITCVLVVSMALFTYVLYHTYTKTVEENLRKEADIIAVSLKEDENFLEKIDVENLRITLIATDGKVTYDSKADVSTMENHKDRPEVRKAILDGEGGAIRTSSTLAKKTIYYATLVDDTYVLRISQSYDSLFLLSLRLASPVIFVVLLGLVAAVYLAKKLSATSL